MFNDGASWQGRLKSKARLLVSHHYSDALLPDFAELGGGQAEYYGAIKDNVAALLDGSFLLGPPDAEVSAMNALKSDSILNINARTNRATLRTQH